METNDRKTIHALTPNSIDCLLQQSSYSEKYKLLTESVLMMGEQNPLVKTAMQSNVEYTQSVKGKGFITSVDISNLNGTCNNPALYNSLQELYVIADINPRLTVSRNKNGMVKEIKNMKAMWNEWYCWQNSKLNVFLPNKRKQELFINNFEHGLKKLPFALGRNLQYMLLFPECYRFKDYPSIDDKSSGKIYVSRFVENMQIPHWLSKESYERTAQGMKIAMFSVLPDGVEIYPKSFYKKNLPHFSADDYHFSICTEYLFDPDTSKIIHGKLLLCERLHTNFYYKMEISMSIVPSTDERLIGNHHSNLNA